MKFLFYYHPFWSVDRQDYISAGELVPNERVLLYNGDTKRVINKLSRPGPEFVYNLEVFGEHVYHVTTDGVLVHNNCELHHFATNKNKRFQPQFEDIISRYGLKLDEAWNKAKLPHKGRHANDYHKWVLEKMKEADDIANGNVNNFLVEFKKKVIDPVTKKPEMMYKKYWRNL
jgi:hypothetical protein